MFSVGKYKMESLPGFLQPTKKLMNMVSAFYEKVKGDVLQFYYVSSIRPIEKVCVFRVTGLKILGRGDTNFFLVIIFAGKK